jgi:hypothetical protein
VPLDHARPGDPTISVFYALIPASGTTTPVGTFVAQEGGPRYSTLGTGYWYHQLFQPLLTDRNFLLVDARGTGQSRTIRCPGLQS